MMRILTLFVRHGSQQYYNSHLSLNKALFESLHDVQSDFIILDNALPLSYAGKDGNYTVLGASNDAWEFSAWDSGIEKVQHKIDSYDFINLVTSAWAALPCSHISMLSSAFLHQFVNKKVVIGKVDHVDQPLEIDGHTYQRWLRSSFLLFPPCFIHEIKKIQSVAASGDIFSGNCDAPFSHKAPLNQACKAHLYNWLVGPQSTYHSRFDLTADTMPYFQAKVAAILNEHALSLRIEELGYSIVDIEANRFQNDTEEMSAPGSPEAAQNTVLESKAQSPKTLFIYLLHMGETFFFKALIDAYCTSMNICKTDVVVLLHSSSRCLYELAFAPEGYTCVFFNPERAIATQEGAVCPEGSQNSEVENVVSSLLNHTYERVIHVGCSVCMPWLSLVLDMQNRLCAQSSTYVQMVFGHDAMRDSLYSDLFYIRERLSSSDVFYACHYNEFHAKNIHLIYIFSNVLSRLCVNPVPLQMPSLYLQDREESLFPRPYVACNLGATDVHRKLSTACFAEVICGLVAANLHVVITGGGKEDMAEQEALRVLLEESGMNSGKVSFLVNKSSFAEDLQIFRQAAFVISNDTGMAHLAHAIGCKLFVATWKYSLGSYFPYPDAYNRPTTRVMCRWFSECPPCHMNTVYGCKISQGNEYPCMTYIQADAILACVQDWIDAC